MAKNKIIEILGIFAAIVLLITAFYSCASIQQPQGGPRDSIAPKVLKMEPKNLSTNFKSEKVIILFDEYFKLQNEFKEFSISPETEKPPVLKTRQKSLEITFPDSLEKNTTYTLNFGKAIGDVNEGNIIKNLTYVFSTGPQLDSLSISGKVTNAVTGQPELDAVAFILPLNRDTLFGKGKPSIYTTTDSSGIYHMNNLREGTYKLYAIQEKNGDKIYQQSSDDVGFLKDSIVLNKNLDSMNLKVFKEDAAIFRVLDRKLNTDGSISLAFNQKLKKPQITISDPPALDATKKLKFTKNNDSLRIWLTDLSFDSVKVTVKDSSKLLQTVKLTRGKKETYTRTLSATDNVEGRLLNPNRPLKLTFNFPVESLDTSKISLLEDSVQRTAFTMTKDSSDLLSYHFNYPWKQKKTYDIKFGAATFTAIFNTKNKEFTKTFELASKDEYGTLKVKIVTPEKNKSYILQIIGESKNVVNTLVVKQDTTVNFANYKAGKYFMRITYDTNKNGIWDTGNVSMKLQPEKIWNEPKELSIRANWERNEIITIPKE